MTWLHDQQFQMMVQRWRSDNPGQEPDEKTIDTLRIQAQMIVDDIARSQYLEEREFLYPSGGLSRLPVAKGGPTPAGAITVPPSTGIEPNRPAGSGGSHVGKGVTAATGGEAAVTNDKA